MNLISNLWTKGKWILYKDTSNRKKGMTSFSIVAASPQGAAGVCQMDMYMQDKDAVYSNAVLMAHAPALMDALCAVLDVLENGNNPQAGPRQIIIDYERYAHVISAARHTVIDASSPGNYHSGTVNVGRTGIGKIGGQPTKQGSF